MVAVDVPANSYPNINALHSYKIELGDLLNNVFCSIVLIMEMLQSLGPCVTTHFFGAGADEPFGIVDCYALGIDLVHQGRG